MIYDSILKDPKKSMNESEYKVYKQIIKDVPRTMQDHPLFQIAKIGNMMTRLLYVWSMRHPESSYVQGFNDLCIPFFIVFINEYFPDKTVDEILQIKEIELYELGEENLASIESDIYWCYTKMMEKNQTNYTNSQPVMQKMMEKMGEIIKFIDKDLYDCFIKKEIKLFQFAFRWMNCYLIKEFDIIAIIRIWDTYFSEENGFNEFHLYVCSCLLLSFSEKLKQMKDFQEMIMFLQNLPTLNWSLDKVEILLAKAYQVNIIYSERFKL